MENTNMTWLERLERETEKKKSLTNKSHFDNEKNDDDDDDDDDGEEEEEEEEEEEGEGEGGGGKKRRRGRRKKKKEEKGNDSDGNYADAEVDWWDANLLISTIYTSNVYMPLKLLPSNFTKWHTLRYFLHGIIDV